MMLKLLQIRKLDPQIRKFINVKTISVVHVLCAFTESLLKVKFLHFLPFVCFCLFVFVAVGGGVFFFFFLSFPSKIVSHFILFCL